MKASELKEQIQGCQRCDLHSVGTGPIPFHGRRSSVMIVGEAPGRNEDWRGIPFVGPAGKLLWSELHKKGVERSSVFVANAVSCYPARTPETSEIEACMRNLFRQIRFCNPRIILALGNSANSAFGKFDPINKMNGWWYNLPGLKHQSDETEILVLSTYHPASVLRRQTLARNFCEDIGIFAEEAKKWLQK